jgi:P27 family predicted phage terminase small subunit
MRGPPPTPLHLRLLKGNPGKRALRPEPQPMVTPDVPEPPGFLLPAAKAEWLRLGPELHALGLLTTLDITAFAVYCQAMGRWLLAEELLAKAAEGDAAGGGLVVDGSAGSPVINPMLRIAIQAARDVIRFGAEFGLTPSSRTRVAAAGYKQPSKFGDLLA